METTKTIEEMVGNTTQLLREQIQGSLAMNGPAGSDAQLYRYSFAVGALLAFVAEDVKDPLMELIRFGLEGAPNG